MISIFNYQKIPEGFRLGKHPDDTVNVFRGDICGLERKGMICRALQAGYTGEISALLDLINRGAMPMLLEKIDLHTSADPKSGLISSTYNPELAQVFATRPGTTLYKIQVPANKVILDWKDIGRSGNSGEVLILGEVLPEWIKQVKINNGHIESELYDSESEEISNFPRDKSNRRVKNPTNWKIINT